MSAPPERVPFETYIVKLASRCNLDCTYCFVYNRGDKGWEDQPHFMAEATFARACERIGEHSREFGLRNVSMVFHGGEPMLAGPQRLAAYARTARSVLARYDVVVQLGMQSNGLLFTEEIGAVCLEHRISVGISIDGPPAYNDRHRVDRRGRGSSRRLEKRLALLTSPPYRRVFSGFLSVVDLDIPPRELFDYLATFSPPMVDIILPYDNHDRLPPGKESAADNPYGRWLSALFDCWWNSDGTMRVRTLESLVRLSLGGDSLVESVGLGAISLIVIESNGDIEAVDSLKASFDGATRLGFNVFSHTLSDVAANEFVRLRQKGALQLPTECQECSLVSTCGGGYIPNRYSAAKGFDNTTIYCGDMKFLIPRIDARLVMEAADAVLRRRSGRVNEKALQTS